MALNLKMYMFQPLAHHMTTRMAQCTCIETATVEDICSLLISTAWHQVWHADV
jgi:hypothetical protein